MLRARACRPVSQVAEPLGIHLLAQGILDFFGESLFNGNIYCCDNCVCHICPCSSVIIRPKNSDITWPIFEISKDDALTIKRERT